MKYDVIIVGAGASGIFAAFELIKEKPEAKILLIEKGHRVEARKCPIDKITIKSCVQCKVCNVMNGFGGAGSLSDGKYNITNGYGGDLYKYIGEKEALDLMNYVDGVLCEMGGADAKLYSTADTGLKSEALRYDLHLIDAKVRHLGTDRNLIIMSNVYKHLKERVEFIFDTCVTDVGKKNNSFFVKTNSSTYTCDKLILATGRSGSKWISKI